MSSMELRLVLELGYSSWLEKFDFRTILKKKTTKKEDIEGNFKIPLEVAEHVYPMNFMILDIKEDEKRPFILGPPFLTTAKAVIKFDKGTITLRSGKSKISFHRMPDSLSYHGFEHRMRKLKMPVFEGEDAYGWIYRVERYFEIQGLPQQEQLRAAALCMEGEALSWYR
ncbi:ankyrin repeat-containing protein [Tanacetum coccineum]|uniref:Ankyrin repeat-containing protein n=1 Tax=Tanacetum coccineum TaxID=301880 RepID=A0ABQ5BB27_9ASTR